MKTKLHDSNACGLAEPKPRHQKFPAVASLEKAVPFRIKNIMVPVDFSARSKKALQYAVAFAGKHAARLLLVHAVEPVLYPENYLGALPPDVEDVNINRARAAKKQLAALCQGLSDTAIPTEVIVQIGRPYEELISQAKARDVDLIIIATHGHTGLKHVFLGSTAERVVRHAPCPVLVVREREHDFVL